MAGRILGSCFGCASVNPTRKDGLIGRDRRCVNAKLGPFGALCDVRVGCALDGSKSQRLSDDDVED